MAKADHTGQGLLFAGARSRRVKRNGRRQNAETGLMRACLDWLALHPGIVPMAWRNNSGLALLRKGGVLKLAPIGSPDIVGFLADGRFLGVECKLPGEEPTEEQAEFLGLIQRSGGVALVVHTVDELAADLVRITGKGDSRVR